MAWHSLSLLRVNTASSKTTKQSVNPDVHVFPQASATWAETQAILHDPSIDALLATPVATRSNLEDLLWRMRSKLIHAIDQGHTGRALWMMYRRDPVCFPYSYRTFARALVKFRSDNGLSSAYAVRKPKVRAEACEPMTNVPQAQQSLSPQSTAPDEPKDVGQQHIPSSVAYASDVALQKSEQKRWKSSRVADFLKTKGSNQPKPGEQFKTLAEVAREHLRQREDEIRERHRSSLRDGES